MCTIGCHIKYDVWWIKYIWKCTGGSHTTYDDKWFFGQVHWSHMTNDKWYEIMIITPGESISFK